MSKIGKNPISLPTGVAVQINDDVVQVTGPLGSLQMTMPIAISAEMAENELVVKRRNERIKTKAFHGLARAVLANMVKGVQEGWEKRLELVGTGYRAQMAGNKINLSIGFSHPVVLTPPAGITFSMDGQQKIIIKGTDRQLVGQTAASIRMIRPPEPYKGKGIRYEGEQVRRKAGKAAKA